MHTDDIDMDVFCNIFSFLGFKRIEVEFNGYGDSGAVEHILLWKNSGKSYTYCESDFDKILFEDNNNKNNLNSFNNDIKEIKSKYKSLGNYLEEAIWNFLPSGFEINEGSYGTLEIDLISHKIDLDQHYNDEYDGDDSELI